MHILLIDIYIYITYIVITCVYVINWYLCIYIYVYICVHLWKNQIHQSYQSTYVQNNRAATCLDCERAPGDPPQGRYRAPSGHGRDQFSGENHGNPGEFDSKTHGKHWWPWKIEELDSETIMLLDFDDFPTSGSSSWKFWGANGCNFCICTSRFPMSIDKHTVVPCSWVIFTMQFCTLMRPYLMGRTGNDVVPSCLVVILPYLMAGNPSMTLVLSAPHLRWARWRPSPAGKDWAVACTNEADLHHWMSSLCSPWWTAALCHYGYVDWKSRVFFASHRGIQDKNTVNLANHQNGREIQHHQITLSYTQ